MRLILPFLLVLFGAGGLFAQLNATLISNLDYDESVNDIWGYVSPDGTEYAIVGLQSGVSIVSLADPANPVEVGRTTGASSPWRDMKTYGEFAYAVADRGSDGLTAIDLRGLPDTISWKNNLYDVPGFDPQFVRAHNIYIDTVTGRAFTAGGDFNVNDGGMLIFDLTKNPMTPDLIAVGPKIYSHDVYVRDSLMYASEIYRKDLAIYNIADLDSIREVGRTRTPFGFTHNAWPSDDGRVVYTTDELPNASVAAFEISDLEDLRLLDQYRPLTSIATRTIPHNVHVIGDYLSISYYTAGLRVVDAADPTNLVEVANYDTWLGADGGFNGDWGAYPFLPSGLTLVSDRQTGLYVVDVTYKKAARIAGTVTSTLDAKPINGARVELLTKQLAFDVSAADGQYATGIADGGFARIAVSKLGFYPDTALAVLSGGETYELNVQLRPRLQSSVRITVVDAEDRALVSGAVVELSTPEIGYAGSTDSLGRYLADGVYDYHYRGLVTAWGYRAKTINVRVTNSVTELTVTLQPGYEDSFVSDLGWTTLTNNPTENPIWQRTVPATGDVQKDLGEQAYIFETNTSGGSTLISPFFDLTDYPDSSTLSFYRKLVYDKPGNNDTLRISMDNGRERVVLANYTELNDDWALDSFVIADHLSLTDSMQLFVNVNRASTASGDLTAGFDLFRVFGSSLSTPTELFTAEPSIAVSISPNPSATDFTLRYDLLGAFGGRLEVFNVSGQRVEQVQLGGDAGANNFGNALSPGIYFARITSIGAGRNAVVKIVKQ